MSDRASLAILLSAASAALEQVPGYGFAFGPHEKCGCMTEIVYEPAALESTGLELAPSDARSER